MYKGWKYISERGGLGGVLIKISSYGKEKRQGEISNVGKIKEKGKREGMGRE
jgi:hypothetical protein